MKPKVLVVDDDPIDAKKAERLLTCCDQPCQVRTASNEAEAMAVLSQSDCDCVVLDCKLGADDGIELLRQIRREGNDVPVVFFTGSGCEEVAVTAMKEEAQDYLVKDSVTAESMRRAVANSIEKVALKRQLDEQRRELMDFVAVVSHDLRNPTASVLTLSEMLQQELPDLSDDSSRMLKSIRRSGKRMKSLIDGLMKYTRAGRSAVPLVEVDLNQVLEGVRAELYGVLKESGAVLEVAPLPVVQGEPVALGQLFQNLIVNGLKYNDSREPRVVVSAEMIKGVWRVAVQDNGIGMEPSALTEIFKPLKRLANGKNREGSGLGLATAAKIAEQHRGRIWAESGPGRGSVFYITFSEPADALG